jgi:hypothetical protein
MISAMMLTAISSGVSAAMPMGLFTRPRFVFENPSRASGCGLSVLRVDQPVAVINPSWNFVWHVPNLYGMRPNLSILLYQY